MVGVKASWNEFIETGRKGNANRREEKVSPALGKLQ